LPVSVRVARYTTADRRHTNHYRALVSGPSSFEAVAPPQSTSGKIAYPATATANGIAPTVASSHGAGAQGRPTTAPAPACRRPLMPAPPPGERETLEGSLLSVGHGW